MYICIHASARRRTNATRPTNKAPTRPIGGTRATHTNGQRMATTRTSIQAAARVHGAVSYGRTATAGQATAGTDHTRTRLRQAYCAAACTDVHACGNMQLHGRTSCTLHERTISRKATKNVVHVVGRSCSSACSCLMFFRATLCRPAMVQGYVHLLCREVRRDISGSG